MNKLPKEKRDKLLLVTVISLVILAGIYFGLIEYQKKLLGTLNSRVEKKRSEVEKGKKFLNTAETVEADLLTYSNKLRDLEETMAPSENLYAWVLNNMQRFTLSLPYPIEIPLYTQPAVGEVNILPQFPYRSATYTVRGNAFYHNFGKFLAAFENKYPHIRIQNLELDQATSSATEEKDREKLNFKMELVTLIKPSATATKP